ncbi:MAG: SusD/RagB family nutrient-binding outer membrane lipoprotein [Bacteroidales bacterium]|nr:SusD/RagB family nutrient-binding outer membrane lipoprotein [Bacteroidales bacterium]
MKKIIFIISIFLVAVTGCTDQFEDFNTDKKHPANVPGEALFSNAQKELADYTSNTSVNINVFKLMAQYWTETTYIDEANYDLVTRNISSTIYFRMYLRILKDLDESSMLIQADAKMNAKEKKNKLAINELMNVYCYAHLVDVFGAIPYTKALDAENVYPKYDAGSVIYTDLMARLNSAISKLDANEAGYGSADLYYHGDVAAWVKFANTMKVRMAITLADADNATAKTAVESAYSKAFASNDDDCMMAYLTSSPNYNQLYADLVASGRHDFVPANTIVDAMAKLGDPRMDAYFRDKMDTSSVSGVEKLAYVGGQYGFPNSYSQTSHLSSTIEAPNFPGIMMSYTELCFYLAEAAERGYSVGGTAESWYNKGVTASFDAWGVSGAAAYLAKPEVAYTTAVGTWKQKIGEQSWIANYTRGYEAYNNWRRLDFPVLNLPEQATKYSDIPVRFTFPVNEQTLNAAEYKAAATLIGGDLITTKVFWDKN